MTMFRFLLYLGLVIIAVTSGENFFAVDEAGGKQEQEQEEEDEELTA